MTNLVRRGRFTLWAIVLLAALSVQAAATRVELVASGAYTASGVSASSKLETAKDLVLTVNVTAISGTSPILDLWLQVSDDGGTTWYDYPADVRLNSVNDATGGTVSSAQRDAINGISTGATGQYLATYRSVASDRVRVKWITSGTSPSFTFSVKYVAK